MGANLAERLLEHYVDNSRVLPWRSPPSSPPPDPYLVWLSEVMLQQTTVRAVAPRFERFVQRWPTIDALAAAPEDDVLGEWAGLGYYARARNLITCAREVASGGGFPDTEAGLRQLPGIGDYTAAAIAAIAFGRRATVIDANVVRIAARLFGFKAPTRTDIRVAVEAITPEQDCGDFAQAMMDLGATICRPRAPLCTACPLKEDCAAFTSGVPEAYPAPKQKAQKPARYGIAHWTERDGAILLVRRPARGLLGGMAALPGPQWVNEPPERHESLAHIRHVFTHFALELTIVTASEPAYGGWWHPLERIDEAGLPTLYRRAIDAVVSRRVSLAA